MPIGSDKLASQLTENQKTRLLALSFGSVFNAAAVHESWTSLAVLGLVTTDVSGSLKLTDFGSRVVAVLTGSK